MGNFRVLAGLICVTCFHVARACTWNSGSGATFDLSPLTDSAGYGYFGCRAAPTTRSPVLSFSPNPGTTFWTSLLATALRTTRTISTFAATSTRQGQARRRMAMHAKRPSAQTASLRQGPHPRSKLPTGKTGATALRMLMRAPFSG